MLGIEGTKEVKDGKRLFAGNCIICTKEQKIWVDDAGQYQWRVRGLPIQDALPNLNVEDRETLMSGCCSTCFDNMFE